MKPTTYITRIAKYQKHRHSGASRNPVVRFFCLFLWIPACAGMTKKRLCNPPATYIIIALLAAGVIVSSGCSKGRVSGLVPCEGIVTWKGEPVEGAQVAFSPQSNDENNRSAFGPTDAAGKFKATTLDANDGIMPGEYFVTITKRTVSRGGAPPPPERGDPDAPREGRNAPRPASEQIMQTHFIPPVYANQSTSGLSAVIPSKGNKNLKFELVGEILDTPVRNR